MARAIREAFTRKRRFASEEDIDKTQLNRCMSAWSVCLVGGGGAAAGAGAHVLAGGVAARLAGPAVVLSFILAGLAAMLAGVCMSEMSARVPRAGSAQVWARLVLGEAAGFLVGWTMLLDLLCGSASLARGVSWQVDSLMNGSVSSWSRGLLAPLGAPYLEEHFDILALLTVLVFGGVLLIGVRQSSLTITALTAVNMTVIAFIIIAGAFKASLTNWRIDPSAVPEGWGAGGFLPYGVGGAVRGAAVCFYGYVGFDSVTFAGEEARDARRSIPLSIMSVIGVSMLVYCALGVVTTLMVPYYLQDVTTIGTVFSQVGWDWARWIVAVGGVFGISASLMSGLYPLSRLLYSMSADSVLYSGLSRVSATRRSPVIAGALATALVAVLASMVELEQLIMTMCIGTLFSYTVVAVCVLMLRYGSDSKPESKGNWMARLFGCVDRKSPSKLSSRIVYTSIVLFVVVSALAATAQRRQAGAGGLAVLSAVHAPLVVILIVMCLQPTTHGHDQPIFKTPMVPLVPLLSIYVNIHLMVHISGQTWIRISIWILIGIPIYLISICCQKKYQGAENSEKHKNGNPPVEIVVEPPTPVSTLTKNKENLTSPEIVSSETVKHMNRDIIEEEILVQQAIIDYNEEKEARIIELIDQVLQAEEDAYGEIMLKDDQKIEEDLIQQDELNTIPSTTSFSELSDAGSELSISGEVLSKYDVIAQVHREDMPVLNEEPSVLENTEPDETNQKDIIYTDENEIDINSDVIENNEGITCFNESETNSRTDESGYSDTTDVNTLDDSTEERDVPRIPIPPPMDENYFSSPAFKKSYTISARQNRTKLEKKEEDVMRESVQSNGSYDDDNIVFGSARQQSFMSKLNDIFQTKISNNPEEEIEPQTNLQRSLSAGNLSENTELKVSYERPQMFNDLKTELLSRDSSALKPVDVDNDVNNNDQQEDHEPKPEEENSLTRQDLKTKLENLFASGGPKPFKMFNKSTSTIHEEGVQTDASTSETITKLSKMEKNDTLKRQKTIFGEVLNSLRISLNKDDEV